MTVQDLRARLAQMAARYRHRRFTTAELQKRLLVVASLERELIDLVQGLEQRVLVLEQRLNAFDLHLDVHENRITKLEREAGKA